MTSPDAGSPVFHLHAQDVQAKGRPVGDGFLILKGSRARPTRLGERSPEHQARLEGLLAAGQLGPTEEVGTFEFLMDSLFASAAEAAAFLLPSAGSASADWTPMVSEETASEPQPVTAGTSSLVPDDVRLSAAAAWLITQQKNLERNERAYKLSGARDVQRRLDEALAAGASGKVNVNPGNKLNLLAWRTVGGLNAIANRNRQVFAEARAVLQGAPLEWARVDRFWERLGPVIAELPELDRRPMAGAGTRASLASYLLFLADPEGHPFYRPSFGGRAAEWLYGDHPLDRRSPAALLQDYVGRCQTLLAALQAKGVPLRDMLDLQGALYLISHQYPRGPGADPVRADFEAFRSDPVQGLRCDIRLARVAQLREELRHPDAVTLTDFNWNVWRFESDVLLDGQSVKGEVYSEALTLERAAELGAALAEDRLTLHGNFCWGSATTVFGAQLALSDDEKQDLIRQALRVLNDDTLSPVEKARRVEAIPGFGPNAASGLTMVFHPEAFALSNRPARDALEALGHKVPTPEAFQKVARSLRERLGAETFPELDWFLYTRPGRPGYWWVNQGSTYEEECAQGYVWASMESGRVISHHENVARLKPGDRIIHYAGQAIRATSTVVSPPVEVKDEVQSGSIPTKRYGYLAQVQYTPLASPLPIGRLGEEWRSPKHGPFDKNGNVRQVYLEVASPALFERVARGEGAGAPDTSSESPLPPATFEEIQAGIQASGLRIDTRTLRRYHVALQTRGFVILSGVSGTGKTWLAEAYAHAAGAEVGVFPVAPNWTSNEDLLGFYSPLDGGHYHHTAFSRFLLEAGEEYRAAKAAGRPARAYHLILDEMNLARVEYYFAQFLSRMELRARHPERETTVTLGPTLQALLGPNVTVIGTVNVDETTHDFADKVYDRAQLIELTVDRDDLARHLDGHEHQDLILNIWDVIHPVAPFAFRVVDELRDYQRASEALGVDALDALDDAVLQKVLPKLRGTDARMLDALGTFLSLTEGVLPLSHAKATRMRDAGKQHGFVSFH